MEKVPNVELFKTAYRALVQELVQCRKQSGVTQDFLAEWLGVDKRKIISFEGLKKINVEMLLLYGDKFSVDIKLNYQIN